MRQDPDSYDSDEFDERNGQSWLNRNSSIESFESDISYRDDEAYSIERSAGKDTSSGKPYVLGRNA